MLAICECVCTGCFQKFFPIENCILSQKFNVILGKLKLIQLVNLCKYLFKGISILRFEYMTILLKFRTQCASARALSRHIFPAHCLFSNLLPLFRIFSALSRKSQSPFVLEIRQLFFGILTIQSKKLPNCLKRPNDGSTSGQKGSPSRANQGVNGRLF